jgi:uncharacterized protein YwgA
VKNLEVEERAIFEELIRISRRNPKLFSKIDKILTRVVKKMDEVEKLRAKGFDARLDTELKLLLEIFKNALISRNEKVVKETLTEIEKLV